MYVASVTGWDVCEGIVLSWLGEDNNRGFSQINCSSVRRTVTLVFGFETENLKTLVPGHVLLSYIHEVFLILIKVQDNARPSLVRTLKLACAFCLLYY